MSLQVNSPLCVCPIVCMFHRVSVGVRPPWPDLTLELLEIIRARCQNSWLDGFVVAEPCWLWLWDVGYGFSADVTKGSSGVMAGGNGQRSQIIQRDVTGKGWEKIWGKLLPVSPSNDAEIDLRPSCVYPQRMYVRVMSHRGFDPLVCISNYSRSIPEVHSEKWQLSLVRWWAVHIKRIIKVGK